MTRTTLHPPDPQHTNTQQELDQLFQNTLYDIHDAETLAHRSLHRPRTPSQELARHLTRLTLHTGARTPEISVEELTLLFSRLSLEPAPASPRGALVLALWGAVATPLEGIVEVDEESDGTMYSCDEGGSDCGSEGTVNEWDEWELGDEEEVVDVQVGVVADGEVEEVDEVDAEANRVMDAIVFKAWIQVVPWVV